MKALHKKVRFSHSRFFAPEEQDGHSEFFAPEEQDGHSEVLCSGGARCL